MDSNNEIGTIQPTHDIAEIIHKNPRQFLMTDLTQSAAHSTDIDLTYLGCDFAFGSGQKFGAPRGTGFIYARDPEFLEPFIYGGHQENGLRGGTENLAGIYAMAVQFGESAAYRFVNNRKISDMRTYLLGKLPEYCIVNNDWDNVLPGIISLRTPIPGQQLVAALAMDGIFISAGSACSTGSSVPSSTLKAIGLTDDEANRTVRISLNAETTKGEIDTFVEKLDLAIRMLK
jgi:cysteine desulfurase